MTNNDSPMKISVWYADSRKLSENETRQLLTLLPSSEQQRYDSIKLPRRRNEFLVGRAMVRQQLASHYDQPPQHWEIIPNKNGKPKITAGPIRPDFSISHSRGVVACAIVDSGPLGIDIEHINYKRDIDAIARKIFNPTEQTWFNQKKALKTNRFYQLWTLKEAWAKATEKGINAILCGTDLMHPDTTQKTFNEENFTFFCPHKDKAISNYWLCHFTLAKHFICGVVLNKNNEDKIPILTLHNYIVKNRTEEH